MPAVIQFIINLLKKIATKIAKGGFIKAVGKYGGRAVIRKSGVWGIYGSIKSLTNTYKSAGTLAFFKKLSKSLVAKNTLRSLGKINYIRDLMKKGIKYTLKQIVWQNLTPMDIKKLYYLHQNFQTTFKQQSVLNMEKSELWEQLSQNNTSLSQKEKIEVINKIDRVKLEGKGKEWKEQLLDDWFYFNVNSNCGNFNQWEHRWNPSRKIYIHPIRSGGKMKYVREYIKYYNVSNYWIKRMIDCGTYGKQIYWPHFRRR